MKAITWEHYGPPDALELQEIDKPVPKDHQVLLRVRVAAVNPLDWRLLRGEPRALRLLFGLRKPNDPRVGRDVAGEVESVGRSVTEFKPGDAVFGACHGAFAEYACTPAASLARKPEKISLEWAAAVPVAGLSALQGLRDKGRLQPGQKVLINGAAGGVGTFAVQIAKGLGAEVTGVCSTRNVEMVRSIGADHVIDYTQEDFTRQPQRYDLILDCVGNHSLSSFRRVLRPKGSLVIVGAPKELAIILGRALGAALWSLFGRQRFTLFIAKVKKADLSLLGDLMASGKVTPVIDRTYALHEAPEAIRYLEGGHARGKVLIRLDDAGKGVGTPAAQLPA